MRRRGGLFSEWKRVRRSSPPRLFRQRCPDIPSAIHSLVCNDTQWSLWLLHSTLASRAPRLLVNYVIRRFASWKRYLSVHRRTKTDAPCPAFRYVLLLRARYLPTRGFLLRLITLDNRFRNKCEQVSQINSKNGIDRSRGGRARVSETSALITRIPSDATSPCINTERKPFRRRPRAPQGSSKTAESTSKGVDESARQIEPGLCKTRPKAAERKPGRRVAGERDETCNTLSLSPPLPPPHPLSGAPKGIPERKNFAAVSRSPHPNAGPRRFRGDYTMKYISPLPAALPRPYISRAREYPTSLNISPIASHRHKPHKSQCRKNNAAEISHVASIRYLFPPPSSAPPPPPAPFPRSF